MNTLATSAINTHMQLVLINQSNTNSSYLEYISFGVYFVLFVIAVHMKAY